MHRLALISGLTLALLGLSGLTMHNEALQGAVKVGVLVGGLGGLAGLLRALVRRRATLAGALGAGVAALGWLALTAEPMGAIAPWSALALGGGLAFVHSLNSRLDSRPGKVPVTVLTGFLGSGKTTVLNQLLARPELGEVAVIINEFGEISVDHLLVRRVDERMVALESGCVCCSVRGDLLSTIDDLFKRVVAREIPPFRRILIETTGLAEPGPILHTLMGSRRVMSRCVLDGVVTVVDGELGLQTLDRHPEAVRQAAMADRILISKVDRLEDEAALGRLAELERRLSTINAGAVPRRISQGEVEPGAVLHAGPPLDGSQRRWLDPELFEEHEHGHDHDHHEHDHHDHDHGHRHDGIESHCVVRQKPIPWGALNHFFELLAREHGDHLLRVKGLVHVEGRPDTPAVIHGVQHLFHPVTWLPGWPDDDHQTRLVFITRGLSLADLTGVLDALGRESAALKQMEAALEVEAAEEKTQQPA